jgi:hypothetical protein
MDKVRPYASPAVYERLEWVQHFLQSKMGGGAAAGLEKRIILGIRDEKDCLWDWVGERRTNIEGLALKEKSTRLLVHPGFKGKASTPLSLMNYHIA